jgi:hypothetical protein
LSFQPEGQRPRRPPRSRGAGPFFDNQTILVRRAIAVGVGLLVILLLFFGIRGCVNSRKDSAFRNYASDVRALVAESHGVSNRFFQILSNPKSRDALDVQNDVNAQSTDAEQLVERAKSTDRPGELGAAHQWIVTSLELRRDALKRIAQKVPAALGDKGRKPAIESIAGQMQALLASDVIYLLRAVPELQQKFQDRGLDEEFPTTRFLPVEDLGWLQTSTVQSRLAKIGNLAKPATPGVHGTGIQGVTAKPSGTVLSQQGVNRVQSSDQLTFDIDVQNQGESEETDVGVSVSIQDGKAINLDQTINRIAAGDAQTVSIPISPAPATGTLSKVTIQVAAVPGEKVTDNNKATYRIVFTKG